MITINNDSVQILHNKAITVSYTSISVDVYLTILDVMTRIDNDHLFINTIITNSVKNRMRVLND